MKIEATPGGGSVPAPLAPGRNKTFYRTGFRIENG